MTSPESSTVGRWGSWRFDASSLALVLDREPLPSYSIALQGITGSACMLDVIFDIRAERWADNSVVGDLISAFQEIFDPRATLCRGGRDTTIDPLKHLNSTTVH